MALRISLNWLLLIPFGVICGLARGSPTTAGGDLGDPAALLKWMHESAPAAAMREGRWLYPIVEALHILGFVLLVGAALMFDVRLLGFSKHRVRARDVARHVLPWSVGALLLVVPTGLLLFSSDAMTTWENPAFRLKLILLVLAGANAALFQWWIGRSMAEWDIGASAPWAAKASAVLSMLLWAGVIGCGRLIAYV